MTRSHCAACTPSAVSMVPANVASCLKQDRCRTGSRDISMISSKSSHSKDANTADFQKHSWRGPATAVRQLSHSIPMRSQLQQHLHRKTPHLPSFEARNRMGIPAKTECFGCCANDQTQFATCTRAYTFHVSKNQTMPNLAAAVNRRSRPENKPAIEV